MTVHLPASICSQEDEEREKQGEELRERMKKEHKKNIEVSAYTYERCLGYSADVHTVVWCSFVVLLS